MKNTTWNHSKAMLRLTILAAAGLFCVTAGIIRMVRVSRQNEELLKSYQRATVNQLIDYVDLTLSEEFFDVRETLGNMIDNPTMQEHEREALETGDFDGFAEHVNVALPKSSRLIRYCFGCSGDRHLFGEVPPALLSDPDFPYPTEGEAETFVVLGGNWYMSFRAASAEGITYYILIDFTDFFNTFLPESTLHQNWIVLYDEKNHVFFQNHDNQPFMVSADREELEKRADGYTLIAGHTEKQEAGFDYYEYQNYDGDTVVNCLCTRPYRLTQNGFLSIGIAQGITAMSNVFSRSFSFLQPALVSAAGLLLILFALLRVRTEHQMREAGMKVLETENELITVRNKLSLQQMQPHFLYNALASIREVVLDDPEYASELLCDFTTHLRACIRGMADVDQIPFRQELENIRAYLNIEKMRFGSRLSFRCDIRCEDFFIVPLSVQPLVENAVKHGIFPRGKAGGTVTLSTAKENGYYRITVSDDGVGFDYEAYRQEIETGKRDSAGLSNLTFRLKKIMDASVDIHSEAGVGTEITVRIPEKQQERKLSPGESDGNTHENDYS